MDERLTRLEKTLGVQDEVGSGREHSNIASDIQLLTAQLAALASKSAPATALLTRANTVQTILDREAVASPTLSAPVMRQFVTASSAHMKQSAARLQEIDQLKDIVNSPALASSTEHTTELAVANATSIEQLEVALQLQAQVTGFLGAYEELMQTMSQKFVEWSERITKLEEAVKLKQSAPKR